MQKTILITGCSSGIGAALAREFGRRGHRVYATARRREALATLEADGIHGLALLRSAVALEGQAVLANVGSIVGLFTTPFAGAYCSSKAAVHSLTDALRMELAPFGIHVASIQPGGVRSSFGEHAEEAIRLPDDSIYRAAEPGIRARAQAGQRGATPAEAFVVPVVESLLRNPPPRVIRGGANSVRLPLLKRLLPAAVFDAKLSRLFGLDALR